jgi:ProP effector
MTINTSKPIPATDPRALLKTLQKDFPVFRECKPLAIGIDKQLLAKLPELDRKALRTALGMHTHSTKYLKALTKGITRFDLDSHPCVELTEAHRQHATDTLLERSKKDVERRKEQQEQEAAERKREAEERQRSEKLEQLAAKFGRGS